MAEGTAQRLDERALADAITAALCAQEEAGGDDAAWWECGTDYVAELAASAVAPLVRGQADALQAATDERDGLRNSLTTYKAEANGALVLRDRERDARRAAEAALQRVRELRDELATPPRDPVHRGIPLPTVGRQFVLHRLDAALGVGVPTENTEAEDEALARYVGALARGLSDAEARADLQQVRDALQQVLTAFDAADIGDTGRAFEMSYEHYGALTRSVEAAEPLAKEKHGTTP